MPKPRILVIGPTPPPYNGMSVVNQNLLGSDLKNEFELIFLDIADQRGLTNVGRLDWLNVTLALQHGLVFICLLLSHRPQIVYIPIAQGTWGFIRDCLFLIPARLARVKTLIHLHGSAFCQFYKTSPLFLRLLIRWILGGVSGAIVLSKGLRKVFSGLVPEDRIYVIPNGIQPVLFSEQDDSIRNPGKVVQIIFLGTLTKDKGFLQLLCSMPRVVAEEPQLHFVFAGEHCYPGEITEAREFIERNELFQHISIPGVVAGDAKMRLFRDSDIFVFPPIAPEGQPLVILEAMSAGLPIISTPQGAIPETIEDGVNGFIVPPADPQAIADKILLLARNPELRRRMGSASRQRFLKSYTLDRWASDLGRVFCQLLAEN